MLLTVLFALCSFQLPASPAPRALPAIERANLAFHEVEPGTWVASHASHGLEARIDRAGLAVRARDASTLGAAREVSAALRTRAFGRIGATAACDAAELAVRGPRAELHRAAFTEWFVHDARGIEQGWTIHAAPPGDAGARVRIEVELQGLDACAADDGLSARFVDAAGATRLRYDGLRAFDAAGRDLAARIVAAAGGFAVEVAAEGALYPLTVDPLLTGPQWFAESDQELARFGLSVADAGDVNGDGYADVVVSAPAFSNGETGEGRAYLYLGSAGGLSATAAWTAEGDQDGAFFGVSVSGAGDVNGDGFADVVVGARHAQNGQSDEGRAYLFLGSASGLSPLPQWIAESDQTGAEFGGSVSGAGDVDGDGFDDVLVGASGYDNYAVPQGQQDGGRAYLYRGSASGLSAVAAWTASGSQIGASVGNSVSGAGDVNGDGFDDVMVAAYRYDGGQANEGLASVYLGSAAGLAATPVAQFESDQADSYFGWSVSGAGDVDSDGYDDVIVGAWAFDDGQTNEGRAYLYRGSASGTIATPAWSVTSNQASAIFGAAVSGAGDVNGDGFDDVVVGASAYDAGQADEGAAFLYTGSPGGLTANAVWRGESDQGGSGYGNALSTAGDVDGDGLDDVVVGAYYFAAGQPYEGRAFLYRGEALTVRAFCFGDGTGTACPCGNSGAAGNGCANSLNPSGANLSWSGTPSVGNDTLVLLGTGMPNGPALYFQGTAMVNGGAGSPFGDGLRCAATAVVRLGTQSNAGGASQYPAVGNPSVSVRGAVAIGDVRTYQAWYRNAAAFCTTVTSNLSNGLEVRWAP